MNSHHTPRSGAMLLRLLFTGFAVLLLGALTVLPALAAGTWTTTGSMSTARNSFTATRLANGQVLVAGGVGCSLQCSSAELFTP